MCHNQYSVGYTEVQTGILNIQTLTVLEGLRLSCDRLLGGYWKSAGSVVFLLLVFKADLLIVVAAWK